MVQSPRGVRFKFALLVLLSGVALLGLPPQPALAVIGNYAVTYSAGPGGSIQGQTSQNVAFGMDALAVTAVPDTGYHFVSWSDGAFPTAWRWDRSITANKSATAYFAINTYKIVITQPAHGSISPSGTKTVNYGTGFSFTVTPDAGYEVVSATVNGSPLASTVETATMGLYLIQNVTSDHYISATIAPIDPGKQNVLLGKPAIVLVNGWLSDYPGDMTALKRFLEKTNSRGTRIYGDYDVVIAKCGRHATASNAIDTEGGLDENVSRFATWLAEQDGTKGTLDLRSRPIIIVGHSMGGLIARGLVSTGAKGRLSHTKLAGWDIPKHVVGVVQLASPNEGSALAAALNNPGGDTEVWASRMKMAKSDATWSLAPEQMIGWNSRNAVATVPIQRGAGLYLPTALDEAGHVEWQGIYRYLYSLQPDVALVATAFNVLDKMDAILGRVPSDGIVTRTSAISQDTYFDGGGWLTFPHLSHGNGVAGDKLVLRAYIGSLVTNEWLQHEHQHMIPSPDPSYGFGTNPVFDDVLWAIRNPGKRWGNGPNTQRAQSAQGAVIPDPGTGSRNVPPRTLTIPSGGSAPCTLAMSGAPVSLTLSSTAATPVIASVMPAGSVDTTVSSEQGEDGTYYSVVELAPHSTGTRTLSVALGGAPGSVKVTGSEQAGPELFLDVTTVAPIVGRPVQLQSRVESAGVPIAGGSVVATVTNGVDAIAVGMHDDGVSPDTTASDGVFSGQAALVGASGDWYAVAEATGPDFQRQAYVGFSAGSSAWARFTGSVEETTEAGGGGTIARWGIAVPIDVSEPGTYSVTCDVADTTGRLIAQPSWVETCTIGSVMPRAWVDGRNLAGMTEGPLTVSNVRLFREVDGELLNVDTAAGVTTASHRPSDFEDFSLVLAPAFSSPTSSTAQSFSGTARYTPGSVADVEYSLDGGQTWTDATPSDGAFDSAIETFAVDLNLGEGLYGILVRSRTADGQVLADGSWGAFRFLVDTTAPSAPEGIAAMPDLSHPGADRVTWSAPESPSNGVAPIGYQVSLDVGLATQTYDTTQTVPLPDLAGHTIRVRAVDDAGNAGPFATVDVGDSRPPTTTCDAKPTYTGAAHITLAPTDAGTGVAQTLWWIGDDASSPTSATVVDISVPGAHRLHYLSVDRAGNREDTQTASFTVSAPASFRPVYRFRNLNNGYYLWSADEAEKSAIVATLFTTWKLEGEAYRINTANSANQSPLWRFRNNRGGFYLYSADAAEKARIIATLKQTWTYEGEAYKVSTGRIGRPVWRFRNKRNGTYLYSADAAEKDNIVRTLASVWQLEGGAFYLAP